MVPTPTLPLQDATAEVRRLRQTDIETLRPLLLLLRPLRTRFHKQDVVVVGWDRNDRRPWRLDWRWTSKIRPSQVVVVVALIVDVDRRTSVVRCNRKPQMNSDLHLVLLCR
jgi:hypothetical protein